jgi:superfamily II DNA/RNA helicase
MKNGTRRHMIVDDSYGNLPAKFEFKVNINMDIPMDRLTYFDRMGSFGSYGPKQFVINLISKDEKPMLEDIEKMFEKTVEELPEDLSFLI